MQVAVKPSRRRRVVSVLLPLGVLLLIALFMWPNAVRFRELSRRVECSTNLVRISSAMQQYFADPPPESDQWLNALVASGALTEQQYIIRIIVNRCRLPILLSWRKENHDETGIASG